MTSRGIQLVLRMGGQSPKLPPMAEDNLREATLQRPLQYVVPRRAHVDVAIIATRSLWIDGPYTAGSLGQLKDSYGFHYYL